MMTGITSNKGFNYVATFRLFHDPLSLVAWLCMQTAVMGWMNMLDGHSVLMTACKLDFYLSHVFCTIIILI